MKLISNRALRAFAEIHPLADAPLQGWRQVIEKNAFASWGDLRQSFGKTIDKVGDKTVFDIGGNKFRIISHVRYEKQIVYVKAVLTHKEYDTNEWKK
jgi:mRNA interferase HigB